MKFTHPAHLLLCLPLMAAAGLAAPPATPVRERQVQVQVAGELPEFTIAREFAKLQQQYPFISPIANNENGAFIAHKNLVYRSLGDRDLRLDLFQPDPKDSAKPRGPYPAVLLVHGGGWRSGDRSHQVPMAQALAAAGFVAVAVEYRLSREALYPAGIDDLREALRWLRHHSRQFAIDGDRIAILGASSGAHMATLVGASAPADSGNASADDARVQAIINLDGVVDLVSPAAREFEDKPGKLSYAGLWLGGRFQEFPALWREASPLEYVDADTPPTLFINSALPRFHVGRDEFVEVLRRHGTYYEVHSIPDTPHPFWLFHPWFDHTRDLILAFLRHVFSDAASPAGQPEAPLTRLRLRQLQPGQRQPWLDYLRQSDEFARADKAALDTEVIAGGLPSPLPAPPLGRDTLRTQQAAAALSGWPTPAIVDHILSFQTPSGGWSKGTDIYSARRLPGQQYGVESHFVPTFDNGATFAQIGQLARAYRQTASDTIAASLKRAVGLLLAAQYPGGGWPQSYPLAGNYHDWTTYNDDVTANAVNLLIDILDRPNDYAVTDTGAVRHALDLAVENIIADQRPVTPDAGAWGQQHDPLSHELRPARAFEMPALASMETTNLLLALMRIDKPSPTLQSAVHRGIRWLSGQRMSGQRWQRYPDRASELVADPTAPDLWPRLVDAVTGKPLFGDRDGTVHREIGTISIERQNAYAWYHGSPARALARYPAWQQQLPDSRE